jgi:hypothetical protein
VRLAFARLVRQDHQRAQAGTHSLRQRSFKPFGFVGCCVSERHSTKDLFYGYPDWLIAGVCAVHIQTARHWKSGIRKPGPTALRLWELYTAGRILSDAWEGWGTRRDALCTPEGQEITQQQLRAWPFIWQLAQLHARTDPRAAEQLARVVRIADADRIRKPRRSRAATSEPAPEVRIDGGRRAVAG